MFYSLLTKPISERGRLQPKFPKQFHELNNRPFNFCNFWHGQVRENPPTPEENLKKRLWISKIAKFEIDLLKTNKQIASQIREILQKFFMMGAKFVSLTIQTPGKFSHLCDRYILAYLRPFWVSLSSSVNGFSLTGPWKI